MSSSSSLGSSSSLHKSKKRRFSKEQLLKHLEILSTLPTAMPPYSLPPSPPCSREPSPALPLKRKSDPSIDSDRQKRPRTSSVSDRPQTSSQRHHQSQQPSVLRSSHQPSALRSEPAEDGEVAEEQQQLVTPSTSSSSLPVLATSPYDTISSAVPIRRPRRGTAVSSDFEALHLKYHTAGRQLKYSGDARFWSTYPSSHKEYCPLPDPPPSNSSYHKHGGLIARLELLDALVCFAYSLWCRDMARKGYNHQSWTTIDAFMEWCKHKWTSEEGASDAEKALYGLIFMIEAFINARKVAYSARLLGPDLSNVVASAKSQIAISIADAERNHNSGANAAILGKPQSTPPMLPSPASIAPTNSANSTPTNRDTTPSTGRPTLAATAAPPAQAAGPAIPSRLLPDQYNNLPSNSSIPNHVIDAANRISVPIGPQLIGAIKEQTAGINLASRSLSLAQQTLTLPVMARSFPKTFARMIHSTLSAMDEHEPDIEDDEGELFWPGAAVNGDGIGWVCLMGQAMIREFGKAYGYRGLAGVVPKPEDRKKHRPAHPPGTTPSAQR